MDGVCRVYGCLEYDDKGGLGDLCRGERMEEKEKEGGSGGWVS